MLIHSIQEKDIEILEGIFAYLTKQGWVIPEWIKLLKQKYVQITK